MDKRIHSKSGNLKSMAGKGTGKKNSLFRTGMRVILSVIMIAAIGVNVTKAAVVKTAGDTGSPEITVTESLTIYAGNTAKITVSSDSEVRITSWKSQDETIATVSEGVVIAQSVGMTKVVTTLVSEKDNKKRSYTTDVTVNPGNVTLTASSKTVAVGETIRLKTMVNYGVIDSLSYESGNKSAATVKKDGIYGIVTGISEGRAVITAKVEIGGVIKKKTVEIRVEEKAEPDLPISQPANGKKYTVNSEWKGSRVYYGEFEQDNNLKNGKEPILWRVLEITDDTVLLLSEYGLICKNYNDTYDSVTWETSTLRAWLNETFLDSAFTNAEQNAVFDSRVVNSDNLKYGTDGGKDTRDKVFLLSYEEAQNNVYGFQSGVSKKSKTRTMELTPYALQEGYANKDNGNTCWWLRSPGITNQYAAYVFTVGSITDSYFVGRRNDGVRPVIRVKLSSVIFGESLSAGKESYPVLIAEEPVLGIDQ